MSQVAVVCVVVVVIIAEIEPLPPKSCSEESMLINALIKVEHSTRHWACASPWQLIQTV